MPQFLTPEERRRMENLTDAEKAALRGDDHVPTADDDDTGAGGDDDNGDDDETGADTGNAGGNTGQQQGIPRSRLAQEADRRRRAEEDRDRLLEISDRQSRQIDAFLQQQEEERQQRAQQQAAPPVDRRALRRELAQAEATGDQEAVERIEAALEAEEDRRLNERIGRATQETEQRVTRRMVQQQMEAAAVTIYAAFPFLNHAGPDANAEAIDDMVALRDANMRKGMNPVDAMNAAAEKVGRLYAKNADAGKTPQQLAIEKRQREALASKANASRTQLPPHSGGRTNDTGTTGSLEAIRHDTKALDQALTTMDPVEKARRRGDAV